MFVKKLLHVIRCNGGLKKSYLMQLRTDDLKCGNYLGTDKMGNKYYECDYYFVTRNRWVIYSDSYGYDYDASYIHPRWFNWMHNTTDLLPDENCPDHRWLLPYTGNETGTPNEYVPYSTTLPKIIPWVPEKADSKSDTPKQNGKICF